MSGINEAEIGAEKVVVILSRIFVCRGYGGNSLIIFNTIMSTASNGIIFPTCLTCCSKSCQNNCEMIEK